MATLSFTMTIPNYFDRQYVWEVLQTYRLGWIEHMVTRRKKGFVTYYIHYIGSTSNAEALREKLAENCAYIHEWQIFKTATLAEREVKAAEKEAKMAKRSAEREAKVKSRI